MPRDDKARFELLIAEDKNRIPGLVKEKIEELRRARNRGEGAGRLSAVRGERRSWIRTSTTRRAPSNCWRSWRAGVVDTDIRTSSSLATDFAKLDETVKKSSLYIIVAGSVDQAVGQQPQGGHTEVRRENESGAPPRQVLAQCPPKAADSVEVTKSRFEISALKDSDPSWVDALFAPARERQP